MGFAAFSFTFIQSGGMAKMRQEEGKGRDARFWVLMSLWGHANRRNRAWIAYETIMEEIGVNSRNTISESLKYLQAHGAIYSVPREHWVAQEGFPSNNYGWKHGEEPPKQKVVYQLTGVILLDGKWVQYAEVKPEFLETTTYEAKWMGIKSPFLDYEGSVSQEYQSQYPTDTGFDKTSIPGIPEEELINREKRETTASPVSDVTDEVVNGGLAAEELTLLQAGGGEGAKAADKDEGSISSLPKSGYIDLMFETCGASKLSATHQKKLNQPMRVWNQTAKNYIDGLSPLELWETDEAYRLWLVNIIVPELKRATKKPSKANFISTTINYPRFIKFLTTDEGKAMVMGAKRAKMVEPVAQEPEDWGAPVEWSLKDAFK